MTTSSTTRQRLPEIILCFLAFTGTVVFGWLQNGVLFPELATFFPEAREISSLIRIGFFLIIFFVARYQSPYLDVRIISVAAGIACACAAALLYAAVVLQFPLLVVTGFIFFGFGYVWATCLLGVMIATQYSLKEVAGIVIFGMVLGNQAAPLANKLSLLAAMIGIAVIAVFILVVAYKPAVTGLAAVKETSYEDALKSNPRAFRVLPLAVYVCIAIFSLAVGFGLTLSEVNAAPIADSLTWITLLCLGVWFIVKKEEGGEDLLFSFSVLTVIAAFVSAPYFLPTDLSGVSALLHIGSSVFTVLMWLVVANAGAKNPYLILPLVCLVNAIRSGGILLGAVAGRATQEIAATSPDFSLLIFGIGAFVFIATLWLGARRFSFEEALSNIPALVAEPHATTDAAANLVEICEELGKEFGLTKRETEMFALLARGRNSSYLEEYYVISRNTVKTHVKRIYKKLDVHSQQELINLVESHSGEGTQG